MPTPVVHSLLAPELIGTTAVDRTAAQTVTSGGVARLTCSLAAGEEEAFREFHAQYFDRLYQFLLVVSRGQEHEAQEALQETLLRVLRYVRRFDTEEAFWGWLKVVARSAARDAGRKRRRYLALLQNFELRWPGRWTVGHSFEEDNRVHAALDESLEEMDALDRRLIEGKYLDGAPVKELSVVAGLTEKAVESRLLRLRRQLRDSLLKKLHAP